MGHEVELDREIETANRNTSCSVGEATEASQKELTIDTEAFLAHLGFAENIVKENSDGWDSRVLEIDDQWIVRIPRRASVAKLMEAEHGLLLELSKHVSFSIPSPLPLARFEGHPYMMYRRLPGRPFCASDDPCPVARAVAELHSFPGERAAQLLKCEPFTFSQWLCEYEKFRAKALEQVLPLLSETGRLQLVSGLEQFFANTQDLNFVLVHRDLGREHILMSDDGHELLGVIDFGDARFDDAAIDFVGIYITGSPESARKAISAYGKEINWERLRAYYWIGSVYAVFHGIEHKSAELIDDGLDGLTRRLAEIITWYPL